MANSTRCAKPAKPSPDFPLYPHSGGQWAKKIRGRTYYFGRWDGDPEGEAACRLWDEQKEDLLAGRTPRQPSDALTVRDLCNHFLTAKDQQKIAGDITLRSFRDYFDTAKLVVESFGKTRLVSDLASDDFQALRARLAKRYGVHRLDKEVVRTRMIFKHGLDAGLYEKPVRFGPTFKRPSKMRVRAHRQKNGPRMFEAAELRAIIEAADQPLKAMILLGANCGFGNSDCGKLPITALDLKHGWIAFPRPKTAVERRCPLWKETVEALKDAIAQRPQPKDQGNDDLVFLTRFGQSWAKDTPDNPITKVFRILLDRLKLHRPGRGFYTLRHVFETVGGKSRDQTAVNFIMGHVDNSMAGEYREGIDDDRLQAVVDHIHRWLFGDGDK